MRKILFIAWCIFFIPIIYLLSSSIIIAIIIGLPLGFIISRIDNWTAFAAIVTLLALIWAVYHQEIKYIINRPKLELQFFEPTPPHLRDGIETSVEKDGSKPYRGYIITIQLTNKGNITANTAEIVLTNKWSMDNEGNWKRDQKWIAIPLKWVLPILDSNKLNIMTRNLTPDRPYLFNVGSFSKRSNGQFLFTYYLSPISQPETAYPGEHCFEITVYAEKIKPVKRYLCIKFKNYDVPTEGYLEGIKANIEYVKMQERFPQPTPK